MLLTALADFRTHEVTLVSTTPLGAAARGGAPRPPSRLPTPPAGKAARLTTAQPTAGRVVAGSVPPGTPTALTFVNQPETITLARDRIRKLERLEVSLMPPGLLSALS
mgnify:CR=1 FL=1